MTQVNNSAMLRAASHRLAQRILAYSGMKEPTSEQVKHVAKLIEGHAKNYGKISLGKSGKVALESFPYDHTG